MQRIKLNRLNKEILIETIDNGLTVIFCKTEEYVVKCAYFATNYGSKDNDFVPINENKMQEYPKGIAHFLEHKVFEQESGEVVFEKFEKNLARANAFTNQEQTQYHFTCSQNFYENLETLLDFVQSPYFTDKNVEKEKGIISQELVMYKDNPDWVFYEKLYENLFINSGHKYSIGGTVDEIIKITKEDLYKCYNTFYNPRNMYLVITGDLNENELFEFVKKNQSKKQFSTQKEIIRKEIKEPKEVAVKKEILKENVITQRSNLTYKVYCMNTKDIESYKTKKYISIYLESLFGELTTITEDMINDKIIKSEFEYSIFRVEDYIIISFEGNTINHKKFVDKINNIITKKDLDKELFEIHKKSIISRVIIDYDGPKMINGIINYMYYYYNQIFGNILDIVDSLNYDEYKNIINKLDITNKLELIMKPKDKK